MKGNKAQIPNDQKLEMGCYKKKKIRRDMNNDDVKRISNPRWVAVRKKNKT